MQAHQKRFLLALLAYAVSRDIPIDQLCRLSGIEKEILTPESTIMVTPRQMNNLWVNASHLSRDPLFGLHFGESLQLAALGIVGEIIVSSQTIGEGLMHAASLMHIVTDLVSMEVTRSGNSFTVEFIPDVEGQKEFPFMTRQLMDLFMVFTLHEADGLVLEKIKPDTVIIPYEVSYLEAYERVLRCKPTQSSGIYAIQFDAKYWEQPIITANYALQALLLQQAGTVGQLFTDKQGLKSRVSSFLRTNAYLGIPTLEDIASNFNTSPRTLQRKLQEEGVTYQQLADSSRKSLALYYLKSGSHPIKEISYILGYNELSAFTRAFKRWTGTTPASFRKD